MKVKILFFSLVTIIGIGFGINTPNKKEQACFFNICSDTSEEDFFSLFIIDAIISKLKIISFNKFTLCKNMYSHKIINFNSVFSF